MPLSWIDGSLYPDTEVPEDLPSVADRVDFLVRLCGAWDFGTGAAAPFPCTSPGGAWHRSASLRAQKKRSGTFKMAAATEPDSCG